MHQRRVRRQGLLRVEHRRQRLPLHIHQGSRLPRQIRRLRRHRGDGVAPKPRLVQSEHPLVLEFIAEIAHFQVAACDHRLDPRQAQGRGGVYGSDLPMGVGTANQRAVEHPRQLNVLGVEGPAGDLLHCIHPRHARSHRAAAVVACRRSLDDGFGGIDDLAVAGATAQVAGDGDPNVRLFRMGIAV